MLIRPLRQIAILAQWSIAVDLKHDERPGFIDSIQMELADDWVVGRPA
jgi:hypothetical protein